MHKVLVFLLCAVLFAGAMYGLLALSRWRNGGLWPWQDAARTTRPTTPRRPPTSGPPTPK